MWGLGAVPYSLSADYSCVAGTDTRRRRKSGVQYSGACGEDGTMTFPEGAQCKPITCGKALDQANADMLLGGKKYSGEELNALSATITVNCHDGFTLGGVSTGRTSYDMECTSDGEIVSSAAGLQCEQPGFTVSGQVTDAQSASKKLKGCLVTYTKDGKSVGTSTTGSSGKYSLDLPAGTYTAATSMAGYIDFSREVVVVGPISVGSDADLSPSKVLPAGSWRIVLTWGKHSRDLDSYSQWGGDDTEEVAWYTSGLSHYDSVTGIKVVLDRDDTESWGPETSTYSGIGECTAGNKCLIHFMVNNYTPNDGDLGASAGKVTAYKGDEKVGEVDIPTSVGSLGYYYTMTVDARKGQEKLLTGYKVMGPSMDSQLTTSYSWGTEFNYAQWCEVPSFNVLRGMQTWSFSALNKISGSKYSKVDGTSSMTCQEVSWAGQLSQKGWATCPEGYFLKGFYRTGNYYDQVVGVHQLTKSKCCKPDEADAEWGDCHENDLFRSTGWSTCSDTSDGLPTAMVALHHDGGENGGSTALQRLDKMKCCAFKAGALMDGTKFR
jgi:hypothetical protein